MGIYYSFACVNQRVLIWWTESNGQQHERWFEGADAEQIRTMVEAADEARQEADDIADMAMQKALRRLVSS